jgi:hypothetical protein
MLDSSKLDSGLNILLDAVRRTLGKPDRLRCRDHLSDEPGIGPVMAQDEMNDLFNRTLVRLGDIEPGVGVEAPGTVELRLCRSEHRRRCNERHQKGAKDQQASQLS